MESLGTYLLQQGVIDSLQLDEALQAQVISGCRLGTSLVELGVLSLEELARHLSERKGTPLPPQEWVENPDSAAIEAVSEELIRRHKILPLKLEEREIHVAMMDPLDPGPIDDLGFATSRRVKAYLLPELALFFWLERHFGVQRDIRYINLGEEAVIQPPGAAAGKPKLRKEAPPDSTGAEAGGLDRTEELIDEKTFAELFYYQMPDIAGVADAPREGDAAPDPSQVAALEIELANAADRDSIGDAAVRIACCYARVAGVFMVNRGMIQGMRGAGEGLEQRIQGMLIPAKRENALGLVAATGEPFRGELSDTGIDGQLLRALGREDATESVILPIRMRGRVVNLLYADNGPDPVTHTGVGALDALCGCIASAYQQLILRKKTGI